MKREVLKRYRRNGFTLSMYETDKRKSTGQEVLAYRLLDRGKLVFEGSDFGCSPMHAIDSLDAVCALLGFLSLKPGDTDSEYFERYTPAEMEWCQSARCEELAMIQFELQERLERKRGRVYAADSMGGR